MHLETMRFSGAVSNRLRHWVAGLLVFLCANGAFCANASESKRVCELGDNSVFVPHRWPEQSLDFFANVRLGVIDPRYDHFYLFIAYRNLIGKPLNAEQIYNLRSFDPCWDDGTRGGAWGGYDWRASPSMVNAQKSWEHARRVVFSLPFEPLPRKPGERSTLDYLDNYIPNCNADAYRNAAQTLEQRIASHGVNTWIESWVTSQDRVFGHCEASSALLPDATLPNAPKWLQMDRAYQIAVAKFYAGEYLEAAERFDAIALDKDSPWSEMGRYLAARALVRQASLKDLAPGQTPDKIYAKAEARLNELKTLTDNPSLKLDADRLLQRIALKTDPYGTRAALDERLSASDLPSTLGQDVRDFNAALEFENGFLAEHLGFGAWLAAMRQGVGTALSNAAELPKTEVWLVARLQSAKPDDKGNSLLLKEAEKVSAESAAYATVRYHMIRLQSNHVAAMEVSRTLLKNANLALTRQDRNRIADASIAHVQSKSEFANLVYVLPVETQSAPNPEWMTQKSFPVVDAVGARTLNELLPLDVLHQVQSASSTPRRLRDALLGVVWVRALILQRWDILGKIGDDMARLLPDAKPELNQFYAAKNPAEKLALGAIFLSKHPGLLGNISTQIYSIAPTDIAEISRPNMHRKHVEDWDRSNWWCSVPEGRYYRNDPIPPLPAAHPMLSAEEAKQWKQERHTFDAVPNATDYLGNIVLDWAATHPKDERLPNALRMLVRSARGGCISQETQAIGKRAFRHLHRHFPKSEAARTTHSHA